MSSENCISQSGLMQSDVGYVDAINCIVFPMPISETCTPQFVSVVVVKFFFLLKSIKAQFSISQHNTHCASCTVCFSG